MESGRSKKYGNMDVHVSFYHQQYASWPPCFPPLSALGSPESWSLTNSPAFTGCRWGPRRASTQHRHYEWVVVVVSKWMSEVGAGGNCFKAPSWQYNSLSL